MANALKELDLVFAMDCTGSMGSYIEQAKQVSSPTLFSNLKVYIHH